jgi:hypothetical protein
MRGCAESAKSAKSAGKPNAGTSLTPYRARKGSAGVAGFGSTRLSALITLFAQGKATAA